MSILTENSRKMLVESMRECLSDVLHESASLTSKQATEKIKFVTESATYEQLLNITMNPHRQEKYQPAYVLEGAVAILHSACMTGRKVIGPNAITEGALKLHKKTGAVITESMLDAALAAATEGCGLKVVGKILNEAFDPEVQNVINMIQANGGISGLNATEKSAALTTLKTHLGDSNATSLWNSLANGAGHAEVQNAVRLNRALKSYESQISRLNSELSSTTTAARKQEIQQLLKLNRDKVKAIQQRFNTGAFTKGSSSAASDSFKKLANSGAGKTPWGKIALGAAAIGGAGALGWKYWKNKQAMQRDMQNGIPQQ